MKKSILRKILFVVLFTVIGLILLQFPFTKIMGSKQAFSGFDFFGPISGGFLGSWPAVISVVVVKFFNNIIHGNQWDITAVIRLFPMAFAALYFGAKKSKKLIAVAPALCMILFWLHPEGQKAWFFALYWLIPIFCAFKRDRLILNSLGSTFTAQAIGSVAFLYAFNLPAAVWIALIPIVAVERGLFTIGIWASYIIVNTVLNKLAKRVDLSELKLSEKYVWGKKFLMKWS